MREHCETIPSKVMKSLLLYCQMKQARVYLSSFRGTTQSLYNVMNSLSQCDVVTSKSTSYCMPLMGPKELWYICSLQKYVMKYFGLNFCLNITIVVNFLHNYI